MVQIQQQSANLATSNGSITLQLPPQVYRLDKTKVQILFNCPNATAEKQGRVCCRADCLPIAGQIQLTLDGQQIMNCQQLNILQYSHYWREMATDKDQVYTNDGSAGLDRSKKALQVLGKRRGYATSATDLYCATFDFNHFFAGLFSGQQFLQVNNQLVITLQLGFVGATDCTGIAFLSSSANNQATAATAFANSVNSANNFQLLNDANLLTAVQNVRMRVLACVPQSPPQINKKFQTQITQYTAQSANSVNFTYVPQSGILYGIHMGFHQNMNQYQAFGGISYPDVLAAYEDPLDTVTSRVTYNGLQLIQTSAFTVGDFKSQIRALNTPNKKADSNANECFLDVSVSGEQVQIQTALGNGDYVQSFTFYESIPLMSSSQGMIQ